eukprot:8831448-Lingulodinium_polyedra.AAC.1
MAVVARIRNVARGQCAWWRLGAATLVIAGAFGLHSCRCCATSNVGSTWPHSPCHDTQLSYAG